MSRTKKYFWLKLRRDFFKRHDTKIIESMENGKDYLLFYLKLLVESIDHEGSLRFSDTIPYNDKMLATITDTNIDIVRSAVKVFSELGMMEQLDDGTLFMSHVNTMIGFETSDALRMKEIRDTKKQVLIEQETSEQRSQMFAERSPSVQECSKTFENRSPELELDIEKERERERPGTSPVLLTSWYLVHQTKTGRMIRPSEADRGEAVKAMAQLAGDEVLARQCVDYYWSNWPKLYFAIKKGSKDPDWNFRSFARNITSCIPPAKPDAPKSETAKTCPNCGSTNGLYGQGCFDCGYDYQLPPEEWRREHLDTFSDDDEGFADEAER